MASQTRTTSNAAPNDVEGRKKRKRGKGRKRKRKKGRRRCKRTRNRKVNEDDNIRIAMR